MTPESKQVILNILRSWPQGPAVAAAIAEVEKSFALQKAQPDAIHLILTRRDADVLRRAAYWVDGEASGPRGAFDRMAEQLEAQGVVLASSSTYTPFFAITISCQEDWPAKPRGAAYSAGSYRQAVGRTKRPQEDSEDQCPECSGRGRRDDRACAGCDGRGYLSTPRSAKGGAA